MTWSFESWEYPSEPQCGDHLLHLASHTDALQLAAPHSIGGLHCHYDRLTSVRFLTAEDHVCVLESERFTTLYHALAVKHECNIIICFWQYLRNAVSLDSFDRYRIAFATSPQCGEKSRIAMMQPKDLLTGKIFSFFLQDH